MRVMVVDDDPLLRRAFAGALARGGNDVSTADNVERALRLAEVVQPAVALVDLHMPGGGLELVRELKRLAGDTMHVAVISGEDPDWIREECMAAGADAVLGKPVTPGELRRHVAGAMIAVAYASEALASVAS
jgi:two-component system nitrate/nitrite response regulator NarL